MFSDSLFSIVQKGFDIGEVEAFLNKTLVIFFLKVVGLEVISQFRPISLCMVSYKLLTKVIVNQLKPVMSHLVAKNQTSFVRGRHIMDNVIIAQEVMYSMRVKKGRKGWMSIKIDLERAYDRLRWGFIEDTLIEAQLPQNLA